jgi:hypothetical protein
VQFVKTNCRALSYSLILSLSEVDMHDSMGKHIPDGYTGRRITLAEVQEVSVENLEGKSLVSSLFHSAQFFYKVGSRRLTSV